MDKRPLEFRLGLLVLILNCAQPAFGDFDPIVLTANSYNQDVIVERTAPPPVVPVTTASMDEGTANLGFTWFERGYILNSPATGLPPAASTFTSDLLADHEYQMPPDYRSNNAVLIDAVRRTGVVTLIHPTNYGALSFLTSSGVARNLVNYTLHYQNGTTENGIFSSPNWYNDGDPAWAASGRVDVTSFAHADLTQYNPRLYSVDIVLSNPVSPVASIELSLANGAGHTAVFALSGSQSGGPFLPIKVSGFNEDLVVEASAVKPGFLETNTTATMDNGTVNRRDTWYEQGYYPLAPNSGLPPAGSVITSETDATHRFLLPASYTNSNATLVDGVCSNSTIRLLAPACFSSLSFLTASSHGPATNLCLVTHADGSCETNRLVSPDWLSTSPAALVAHGCISVNTKIPGQLSSDFPRLYAIDMPLGDAVSQVTKIVLCLEGADNGSHTVVLAISGAPAGTPGTRPFLSLTREANGDFLLTSTQAGRLKSSGALPGTSTIWKDEGPILSSIKLPSSGVTSRFYRVVIE